MESQFRSPADETAATVPPDAPAHEVRMRAVEVLEDAGTPLSVTDLALELAGADGTDDADADPVRRLRIGLYHRHLPKLATAGVVDFDHERRTAALVAECDREDLTEVVLTA